MLKWKNKETGEVFESAFMDALFFSNAPIDWTRFELLEVAINNQIRAVADLPEALRAMNLPLSASSTES